MSWQKFPVSIKFSVEITLRWIDPAMNRLCDELTLRWFDYAKNRPCEESTLRWIDTAIVRPCDILTLRWLDTRWIDARWIDKSILRWIDPQWIDPAMNRGTIFLSIEPPHMYEYILDKQNLLVVICISYCDEVKLPVITNKIQLLLPEWKCKSAK
jgi:hypothetical protein